MTTEDIATYLLDTYYSLNATNQSLSVTSAHWKKDGEIPNFSKDGLIIKGMAGFGDFIQKNFATTVKYYLIYHWLIISYQKKFLENKRLRHSCYELSKKLGILVTQDCVKAALVVQEILNNLKTDSFKSKNIKRICVIGDGYGFLGCLLKIFDSDLKIVSINLGRQLFHDVYSTSKAHPMAKTILAKKSEVSLKEDFCFIEAQNYEILKEIPVDLYINVVSMQEMSASIIQNYFDFMKSSPMKEKYFFCLNRKEKRLPDGEIICFQNYPWGNSETLLDKSVPWYQSYLQSRPPFWIPFHGEHLMRLVKF